MPRFAIICALAGVLFAAGCGGGSKPGSSTPPPSTGTTTPTAPAPPSSGGGAAVQNPNVVSVAAGSNTSGVNITVPTAAGSENADNLGVGNTAQNTGTQVHRGSSQQVILFGAGLSGNMTVTISGPGDIAVGGFQTISSKSGSPGIAFTATVPSNAALGARTVFLRASNNDIVAFTGGLEVVP